ncbi:uncharacterized protein LOC131675119 [Phymastichus coffea]|uniref:uncharacterized protein LOC131675119 n=1 Tax=Phymastichus coffea TaxID=108790 RepID=UPI00273CCF11|nr:uncharacterized protein LOC131675119 [Phymastichus coffea]
MLTKNKRRKGKRNNDRTRVAGSALGIRSILEQSYPGGRNLVRKAYELRGTPKAALEVTIAFISESSYKQYEGCFKQWWSYCVDNNVNPFAISISHTLIFLTKLFDRQLASTTINCYRSAISLLVGKEMAQDDRVMRFFQGCYNLRPSKPKYDITWDPKIVLDYLTSLPNNNDLNVLDLGRKLIALLALITGHRMQTFSLIELENIEELDDKTIHIKIPKRIKTSGRNRNQPLLILPYFLINEKICAASTLKAYIEKTEKLRNGIDYLFITSKKPYKAAESSTLSHWVKYILEKSGLDIYIFSAHSTRHASTSTAKRKGVGIDILYSAGWTETSQTFEKFYDREIIVNNRDSFANAILNS